MSYNAASVDPSPGTTPISTAAPDFAPPAKGDAVAVALTVAIVGVCMFTLITWLILRLRRQSERPQDAPQPRRLSSVTARFRPSFASETSSKFGFKRKSLRLVNNNQHDRDDQSWDFADPDPVQKVELPAHTKHIPPPLLSPNTPSYLSSKDEFLGPSSPATPYAFDLEPPPPAYARDDRPCWTFSDPKDLP
ncbi:hypothetical protein SCLCIDRAFT_1221146 [Scleroderma citrinum Foug A]|uniref:Uncharacterized protein n=1 Tax=Scleroderma citrinum Foug A TaxID=1036808 RepID=A0A0C2Z0V5_9AGAM|nr:hypothetical protein SCLCIDRAFT_1221146 [Scleroderma citrinum Foug A]